MCTPAGEVNRTAAAVAEFGLYTVGYSVAWHRIYGLFVLWRFSPSNHCFKLAATNAAHSHSVWSTYRDSKLGHFCNTIVTASTSLVKWNFKWAVSKQQHRVFNLAWLTAFLCEDSWDAHLTDVVNHGHPQEFLQKGGGNRKDSKVDHFWQHFLR